MAKRTQEQQEYRDNLARNLKRLRQYGDTGKELADTLLKKERENPKYKKARVLKKYTKETAEVSIDTDYKSMMENLEDGLKGINKKEVAEKAIENGEYYAVLHNLDKFELGERYELLVMIMEKTGRYLVDSWLEDDRDQPFGWLDVKELSKKLIEKGLVNYVPPLLDKYQTFD